MKLVQDYPLYTIGVVSELLDAHPETIRMWERSGIIQPPHRRSGKRFYSEKDFRKLQFVRKLAKEGLSIRAILYYLRLYSCWKTVDCPSCIYATGQIKGAKPCWQKDGTYCQATNIEDPCKNCQIEARQEQLERAETKLGTTSISKPATNQDSVPA